MIVGVRVSDRSGKRAVDSHPVRTVQSWRGIDCGRGACKAFPMAWSARWRGGYTVGWESEGARLERGPRLLGCRADESRWMGGRMSTQ